MTVRHVWKDAMLKFFSYPFKFDSIPPHLLTRPTHVLNSKRPERKSVRLHLRQRRRVGISSLFQTVCLPHKLLSIMKPSRHTQMLPSQTELAVRHVPSALHGIPTVPITFWAAAMRRRDLPCQQFPIFSFLLWDIAACTYTCVLLIHSRHSCGKYSGSNLPQVRILANVHNGKSFVYKGNSFPKPCKCHASSQDSQQVLPTTVYPAAQVHLFPTHAAFG